MIRALPVTETWVLSALHRPVEVVRTEGNVPHIYAHDRHDLGFVMGFVMARDRYFMMDLSRRLGLGTLSELLGDAALAIDQQSRATGMTFVADQIAAGLTPTLGEHVDAFAAGINAYIARVERDELPAPSELALAQGLLGAQSASELMQPFDRRAVAGMVAVVLYQTSFETGDVGRAAAAAQLDELFLGAAFEALRRNGAREDIWRSIVPVYQVRSAPGFGTAVGASSKAANQARHDRKPLSTSLLARATRRLDALGRRLGRDHEAGFGSNAWAVSGAASTDGAGLLAGDGHLSLAVPSILYQLGLDTSVLGRGETHQLGLIIAGFPVMPIGTNGQVAWSQTQLDGDVTDWYREQLRLDAHGLPEASLFLGDYRPLEAVEERYVIADVPLLGSVGRTERWTRWQTFDGRWIYDIEGRDATADEKLGPGEALVNLQGSLVVPGDIDGDGVVTAISFDYGGFDAGAVLSATDKLGHARDVREFREGTRGLVAYSQNFAVADSHGSILYSSYQAVPCRAALPHAPGGDFADGADPSLLLDGTRYGAFEVPVVDGVVDETAGATDPARCVVPFDAMPQSIDPPEGYVFTANNDPGGLSFDGSVTNDAWYIGGPWCNGFRAHTISTALAEAIAAGEADEERMAAIQGDVHSVLGELLLGELLRSVEYADSLPASPTDPADERIAALYAANADAIFAVFVRLGTWAKRGYQARSGVETFYSSPSADDREDAVATMIFNAWLSRVIIGVFDDEQLPGIFRPGGSHGQIRALNRLLRGRGPGNPEKLASFNPTTGESVFFDRLGTDEVETSHEIVLGALVDALGFLRSEPEEVPGNGGFGTSDMTEWRWGLRHQAKLQSLLADFLGDSTEYAALTEKFAITTAVLPLAESIGPGDPRFGLEWFPRDGDQWAVDAANPGLSGTHFSYGSGPVMRMVVRLKGGEVGGRNIIPGGQSALIDSPYFADQAAKWLGNDTWPMRFSVADVVAGAIGHEQYRPH